MQAIPAGPGPIQDAADQLRFFGTWQPIYASITVAICLQDTVRAQLAGWLCRGLRAQLAGWLAVYLCAAACGWRGPERGISVWRLGGCHRSAPPWQLQQAAEWVPGYQSVLQVEASLFRGVLRRWVPLARLRVQPASSTHPPASEPRHVWQAAALQPPRPGSRWAPAPRTRPLCYAPSPTPALLRPVAHHSQHDDCGGRHPWLPHHA